MCKRLKIPFPKTGYWQNVHAGRDMEIPELEFDSSFKNEISLELRAEPSPSAVAVASALMKLQQEIENDSKVRLQVPQNLHAPDQLVVMARNTLLESNPWSGPHTIRSTNRNQFSINVSKPQIRRALRFVDTLIKALQARGHKVWADDHTYISCSGQQIQVSLKERTRRIPAEKPTDSSTFVPTGVLSFQIEGYDRFMWKDGQQPLEDKLSNILATLESEGLRKRNEAFKHAVHRAGEDEEREVRRLYEKMQENELNAFEELLFNAERWFQAEMIRRYLSEFAAKRKSITPEFQNWIEWAQKKADWYDPIVNAEDELLSETDKSKVRVKSQPVQQSNFYSSYEPYNYFQQRHRFK